MNGEPSRDTSRIVRRKIRVLLYFPAIWRRVMFPVQEGFLELVRLRKGFKLCTFPLVRSQLSNEWQERSFHLNTHDDGNANHGSSPKKVVPVLWNLV